MTKLYVVYKKPTLSKKIHTVHIKLMANIKLVTKRKQKYYREQPTKNQFTMSEVASFRMNKNRHNTIMKIQSIQDIQLNPT